MSPQAGSNDRWQGIITYFQFFSYAGLDIFFLLSVLLAYLLGAEKLAYLLWKMFRAIFIFIWNQKRVFCHISYLA